MLKYLRNLNSDKIPEIMYMPIADGSEAFKGTVVTVDEYGYLINQLSDYKAHYLVVEDKIADDGKVFVKCIRLAPGMVFEADILNDEHQFMGFGSCVSIATDSNGAYGLATLSEGSRLEVIDTNDYQKTNKLIVVFIK